MPIVTGLVIGALLKAAQKVAARLMAARARAGGAAPSVGKGARLKAFAGKEPASGAMPSERVLLRGKKGGSYYISAGGRKVYVG